jgi:hypothetical protein
VAQALEPQAASASHGDSESEGGRLLPVPHWQWRPVLQCGCVQAVGRPGECASGSDCQCPTRRLRVGCSAASARLTPPSPQAATDRLSLRRRVSLRLVFHWLPVKGPGGDNVCQCCENRDHTTQSLFFTTGPTLSPLALALQCHWQPEPEWHWQLQPHTHSLSTNVQPILQVVGYGCRVAVVPATSTDRCWQKG